MSAREIIAEIEALPSQERAEVVQYVTKLANGNEAGAKEIRYATKEQCDRARDEVFTKHAALLEKLSK
jgi:hypothetical protein